MLNLSQILRESIFFQMQGFDIIWAWIQNAAKPWQNSRIGKILEMDKPHCHPGTAAIQDPIAVLERL